MAHSLVRIVLEALGPDENQRVIAVRLKVGELAGVVPDALLFCYDVAVRGTRLEGSRLEMTSLPIVVHCPCCARDVPLATAWDFRCPTCGTPTTRIVQGNELEVDAVELEELQVRSDPEAAPQVG